MVPNLIMIAGAVLSALCGISPEYAAAVVQAQDTFTPDRMSITEAYPCNNPQMESKESLPAVKAWTKGRFVQRSELGSELIQFASGEKYWFKVGDFLPLYRVKGTQPVEIKNYQAGHDDQGKLKWEITSLGPKLYLKPGEMVALDSTPLQLMDLYRFYTEDGRSGVVSLWDLLAVGDGEGLRER